MTIFEIDKEIYNLVDENGEVKDFEAFEALNMEREKKIENIACWYKDLLGDAEKIKAQKDVLAEREKACKNRAEQLKKLLDYALQGEKFTSDKCVISYRKSTKCVIEDEQDFIQAHPEFVVTTEKISVAEVSKALKNGQEISGASLLNNVNLQVK